MRSQFNAEFSAALLAFNEEASVYCQGISDPVAREYAIDYARMLLNRAKGVKADQPRFSVGLLVFDRNLIRSTLEKIDRKFFPKAKTASVSRGA